MASKTRCLANLLVAGSSLRSTSHLAAKILQRPHCRVASSTRPASGTYNGTIFGLPCLFMFV